MKRKNQPRHIASTLLILAAMPMIGLFLIQTVHAGILNWISLPTLTEGPATSGTFAIGLSNIQPIAAGEIRFSYDSTIGLTITNISAGERLAGFTVNKTINTDDPQQAKIAILFFNLSNLQIAPGNGPLLIIDYTTDENAAGTTALTMTNALLSDANGDSLSAGPMHGEFTIERATLTPTDTATPESTPTDTFTPTSTPSDTTQPPTDTPTAATATFTPTATATNTPDGSTITPTHTPTGTVTPSTTPDLRDDLFAFDYELWTEPLAPAAQEAAKVGIVIHRLRGKGTLQNVTVQLAVEDAAQQRAELGHVAVPLLGAHTQETTNYQEWTPVIAGNYTLIAQLDPDNLVAETDETNNVITRTIMVLPPAADRVPPRVTGFTINDGAATTNEPVVLLHATATDPEPASGINALFFIEFEYLSGVNRWTPRTLSPWLPYETVRQGYEWRVNEGAGVKYLQVWAIDQAQNVSASPAKAYINYQPPAQTVAQGATHFYRYYLQQGERLTAHLEPTSGDPDLYVWAPDHETRAPWVSQAETGVDLVTFVAPVTGLYQVEIHGHNRAEYLLTVDITADGKAGQSTSVSADLFRRSLIQAKPTPEQPWIAINSEPGLVVPPSQEAQPSPTPTATNTPTATFTPTTTSTSTPTSTPTPTATGIAPTTSNQIFLPVVQQ